MKGLLFFLSAVICHSASAADYQCVDPVNNTQLELTAQSSTSLGSHMLTLTYADGKILSLPAQAQLENVGKIFFKKKFSIFPFTGDVLTITSAPKHCGRGSCDNFSLDHASLLLNGELTTFNCDAFFP